MPIWKYQIPVKDEFKIEMPSGAQVLTVDTQSNQPCIWVMVDPNALEEFRPFRLVGTGHPCNDVSADQYIGTFQVSGGALVFHLFDARKLD